MLCMSEEIDRESPVTPSDQVISRITGKIERGEYTPGDRLPSIIDMTQIYGIARATAQKVQRSLIDQGYAEISPGLGLFVRSRTPG
jgi:GntR family transcriptional regulator